MIGDLHCHSRFSDGSISIDDLIFYAKRSGMDFISVTDHDTMAGVSRANILGKRYGINVIPGVEISCNDFGRDRQVHILCYLPDKPDRLESVFNKTLESRTRAGKKMIEKLRRYYPVTEEHIERYTLASKSIYKQQIMQSLMDLGYADSIYGKEYQLLFGYENGILRQEIEYPDVYDVLQVIRSAGGISVLAHPKLYDSLDLLDDLIRQKLIDGIEVSYPRGSSEETTLLTGIAAKNNLLTTCGSDFHGAYGSLAVPIGTCITTGEQIDALYRFKRKQTKM